MAHSTPINPLCMEVLDFSLLLWVKVSIEIKLLTKVVGFKNGAYMLSNLTMSMPLNLTPQKSSMALFEKN